MNTNVFVTRRNSCNTLQSGTYKENVVKLPSHCYYNLYLLKRYKNNSHIHQRLNTSKKTNTRCLNYIFLIIVCCIFSLIWKKGNYKRQKQLILFDRSLHIPCYISLETEGSFCNSTSVKPLTAPSCTGMIKLSVGKKGLPGQLVVATVLCR